MSITHLMNLSPAPLSNEFRGPPRPSRRYNVYGIGSGHHFIDKARYIHANYRFIVKPFGQYKQALDADHHLDWNDVLQILVSARSQKASCPVCLSQPVAPRMTKCGHILCLPCIIRYINTFDDEERKAKWRKCPICWDAVYLGETRPVRWITGQEEPPPREGDDVVLRLVMRRPGSTLALPRDGSGVVPRLDDIPWYFAAEVMDYARVMKGSEEYMMAQLDLEIEELQRQAREDELMFGEDPYWVNKAVKAIHESKAQLEGIGNPPLITSPREDSTSQSNNDAGLDTNNPVGDHDPVTSFSDGQSQKARGREPDSPYYFYQALLHYYLAPLDIRILKAAFGSFAAFPSTLLPRVDRVSTGHIVDDDLRKRTKYLSHLPSGCEVNFLECDWTDIVSPTLLAQFQEEIEKRRKRNHEKAYREEKDRQRAERAEDARWAMARRRRPSIGEAASVPVPDAMSESPPWPNRQGSSFAPLASPPTSPSGPRTVWGTAAVPHTSPVAPRAAEENDGWLPHWEEHLGGAENGLVEQMRSTSLGMEGGSSVVPPVPLASGKKKKGKKITLMSTTGRRAA